MKKFRIVLGWVFGVILVCGAALFIKLYMDAKETKEEGLEILHCMSQCLSAVKEGDMQGAAMSYDKAYSLYEQSDNKLHLDDIKEELDSLKAFLDNVNQENKANEAISREPNSETEGSDAL